MDEDGGKLGACCEGRQAGARRSASKAADGDRSRTRASQAGAGRNWNGAPVCVWSFARPTLIRRTARDCVRRQAWPMRGSSRADARQAGASGVNSKRLWYKRLHRCPSRDAQMDNKCKLYAQTFRQRWVVAFDKSPNGVADSTAGSPPDGDAPGSWLTDGGLTAMDQKVRYIVRLVNGECRSARERAFSRAP